MEKVPDRTGSTDENELIERVKAGERDLFGQLLQPYARKMFGLAYSVLRNEGDAEEAVQESALKAFTRLRQLRSSASFKCWLLQITINEARMRKRHARRRPWLSIEAGPKNPPDGFEILPQAADYGENPEQALQRKELESALDQACRELSPKYQRVLQLRCHDDLTISQIGKVLKLGAPVVKTHLHRARLRLRKQLRSALLPDRNRLGAYRQPPL